MKYITSFLLCFLSSTLFAQNYETTELQVEPFSDTIERSGKLAFKNTSVLTFKTNGFLAKLTVDDGDAFEKNQLLAVLDTTELEADKNFYYAKLMQAKRDLTRSRSLLKKKLASQQEVDNAQTALETSRSAYQVAFYNLDKAKIIAPFSGVVLYKHTQLGELQVLGKSVLTVAASERNWVIKVALTGDEISRIKLKQQVEVKLSNKALIIGEVIKIPAIANTEGNLFIIDVLLPELNLSSGVVAGQLANVKINFSSQNMVYRLPIDALVGVNDEGRAIILVEGDRESFQHQYFDIHKLDNQFVYLSSNADESPLKVVVRGWQNIQIER
jgi:RND family efflux transporter MFP subunit